MVYQTSYINNYFKIYIWQGLSIGLGFISMFIVIPMLAGNPTVYGIYSICISFTIFLSYADLGFIGAGYKYAAECIARNDTIEEIKIIGFVSFILLIFGIIYAIIILLFSIYPEYIIKNLTSTTDRIIAARLFTILVFYSVNLIIQRIFQIIVGIRIDDYIIKRQSIIANIANILSVFIFFRQGVYDIVGYYLFCSITNIFVTVGNYVIIRRKYNYDFRLLFKSIRFSRIMFTKTKGLAFSSLYITIAGVLYYEMDLLGISMLLGAEYVAYYAVGYSLTKFFRSLFGALYNPFSVRFNHFVGENKIDILRQYFLKIIILTTPVVLFPALSLIMLMKPFIIAWVGAAYSISVVSAILLMGIYLFANITYPSSLILISQVRIKESNWLATLNLLVFWIGILMTIKVWGINAIAFFKLITFILSGLFYSYVAMKFMKINWWDYIKRIYGSVFIPALFIIVVLYYIEPLFPLERSKITLLVTIFVGGCVSFGAFVLYYLISKEFRGYLNQYVLGVIFKKYEVAS